MLPALRSGVENSSHTSRYRLHDCQDLCIIFVPEKYSLCGSRVGLFGVPI